MNRIFGLDNVVLSFFTHPNIYNAKNVNNICFIKIMPFFKSKNNLINFTQGTVQIKELINILLSIDVHP